MRKIIVYLVSLLLLASFMMSCAGEAVPIIEMTQAKVAISKAERYGAPRFAAEKYNEAVSELEKSHGFVKDGDLDRAQRRAETARRLAEEALAEAAPRMVEDSVSAARDAIQKAIVVNAEVFAPQELQNAQMELRNAELKMEQRDYDPAIASAQSSEASAQEAYNISMGKKQLIRDAIMEVRQTLVNAQEYGAQEIQPDTFESARTDLATAVDTYRTDKLKESYNAVRSAKEKADELYAIVIEEASRENLAQAQTQLSRARTSAGARTAEDELNASAEMLETARSQHNDGQYRESIDSSNESLRLSALVLSAEGEPVQQEQVPVAQGLVETDEYWVYPVNSRDYLRSIAERFYQDEMKWRYIYNANRDLIRNPDLIYPDWDLKVPKWDQPGGPRSDSSMSEPVDNGQSDSMYDESMDVSQESSATSDDMQSEESQEIDMDQEDYEEAPMIEGEAPETSSDDTVEVMPEN